MKYIDSALRDSLFRCTQPDKQQHFVISFVLVLLFYAVFNLVWAVVATLIIGLIKEVWDHYIGSGFCWWDMLANMMGVVTSLVSVMALRCFVVLF